MDGFEDGKGRRSSKVEFLSVDVVVVLAAARRPANGERLLAVSLWRTGDGNT